MAHCNSAQQCSSADTCDKQQGDFGVMKLRDLTKEVKLLLNEHAVGDSKSDRLLTDLQLRIKDK